MPEVFMPYYNKEDLERYNKEDRERPPVGWARTVGALQWYLEDAADVRGQLEEALERAETAAGHIRNLIEHVNGSWLFGGDGHLWEEEES